MKKHYETLGLTQDASQEDITQAFERLNKTLDPANNDNLDFFVEEHAAVVEAFNALKKTFKSKPEIEQEKPIAKSEVTGSIESIFERYKSLENQKKLAYITAIEQKIVQGEQNYKIALNIICRYENCEDIDAVKSKLKYSPKPEISSKTSAQDEVPAVNKDSGAIAVNDNDTPSSLIEKYEKAGQDSKHGVLAMYTVLAAMGNKTCALALHKIKGESLDLTDELLSMVVIGIANNSQACNVPMIPGAQGEFGLSKTNPVPVYGIPSNERYLKGLKTDRGERITWKRKGSLKANGIEREIDQYTIYNEEGKEISTIFISPYHWSTSTKIPKGFVPIEEVIPITPEVNFVAKASKSSLSLRDVLHVDFEINHDGQNFTAPRFDGFSIMEGPKQSIDKSLEQKYLKTYSYVLVPDRTGNLSIGEATIEVQGQVFRSSALEFTVSEAIIVSVDASSIEYLENENVLSVDDQREQTSVDKAQEPIAESDQRQEQEKEEKIDNDKPTIEPQSESREQSDPEFSADKAPSESEPKPNKTKASNTSKSSPNRDAAKNKKKKDEERNVVPYVFIGIIVFLFAFF